ncbi:MAG: hypothetical protein PHY90_07075 [Desulfitobacteriaceae bacterium]|nr:hypothetical protein [Desulfitobacteriaceae bacterium]
MQYQDQMIQRFQMLTANEGLFSQIIYFCPYPIAVFTPQGILETVNNAFAAKTGANQEDLKAGRLNIYHCISDDIALMRAIRQAFAGETCFLDDLKNPLIGFPERKRKKDSPSKNYHKAIVFPIPAEDGLAMHGVAVFTI